MAFKKYANNVNSVQILSAFSDISNTFTVTSGEGTLFPATDGRLTVEMVRLSDKVVIKREVVDYSTKSGNIISGVTRAVEECVRDDSQTPRQLHQGALDFTGGTDVVIICSLRYTAGNDEDIKNAIDIETAYRVNEDNKKLNNAVILSKTANFSFTGNELNNTQINTDTSSGNIVHTLNPALFPNTNGCYEFIFVKTSGDTNTLTIDAGSGKTIDGSQTYIMTAQREVARIRVLNGTTCKIISNAFRPLNGISIPAITKILTAGEDMALGKAFRKGRGTVNTTVNLPGTFVSVPAGTTVDIVNITCDINFYSSVINTITLSMAGSGGSADGGYFVITDMSNNILYTSSANTYTASASKTYTFTGVSLAPGNYKLRYRSTGVNGSLVAQPNGSYSFIMDQLEYADRCYIAKNIAGYDNVLGVVSSAVLSGNTFLANFLGSQNGYTGLSNGSVYLQSDGSITNVSSTIKMGLQIDATTIFFNRSSKTNTVILTKNISDASVVTQYTNPIGIKPKHIRADAIYAVSGSSIYNSSTGSYNGSSQSCSYGGGNYGIALSSNSIIEIFYTNIATSKQSGVIQNITDTTFEIAWTKTGTPLSSTAQIMLTFYE